MLTQRLVILSLGLAVGAFGQPSISPAQLKLAAQAGSSTAVTEIISLFSSGSLGPNADFDLSIRYGSAPGGWLSVNRIHGTTPATLTISANPSNLPAGTYSAQIVATVGPLFLSAVTSVSFIVAPGGSNPGGLAVNPSSLTFLGDSVSTPQSIAVSNAPGVAGSVPFSVFANPAGWLAVTQSDRVTPATVRVQPNISGVSPGPHTATVTVTALDTGKSTVVPITLVVPQPSVPQIVTLTSAQRALTFNYQLGSSLNPTQAVFVSTDSTQYTNFTATVSDTWLGVADNYGLPATHSITAFAPGLIYVLVDPTGLSAGVYKGSVVLSASGLDPVDVPVTFTVSSSPVLNATPSFISLDSQSNVLSSNLSLTSSDTLSFTAVVAANTPWLSITPNSGISSSNPTDLTVVANVAGLPSGTYNSSISFVGAGGRPALTVPVQLKVSGGAVSNTLEVLPTALDFTALVGDPVVPKYVSISSKAGVSQAVTLAAVADGSWFTVEPLSASLPIYAKVAVSTAVAPGAYTGSIVITALGTGEQATVDVTYKLTARLMTVTPTMLTFTQSGKEGAFAPAGVSG